MDIKRAGEQRPAVYADAAASQPVHHNQRQKGSKSIIVAVGAVVAALLLGLAAWLLFMKDGGTAAVSTTTVNKDLYQAVFLSNGQVYFGKLQNATGESLVLKDIYYLQVNSSIQPSSGEKADVSTKEGADKDNVQLIKLGNELHGPEDQMQITKDQVLFWENLKKDGKVSKAIDGYVKR